MSAEASGWRLRCWKGLQSEGAAGPRRLISWLSQRKWNKRSNSQSPLVIDKGIRVTRAGENETPRINKSGLCSQERGDTMLWSCLEGSNHSNFSVKGSMKFLGACLRELTVYQRVFGDLVIIFGFRLWSASWAHLSPAELIITVLIWPNPRSGFESLWGNLKLWLKAIKVNWWNNL